MRTVLPGRPQSRLQAVTTACWDGRQIIAYISGNAFVVLDGPNNLLQTSYTNLPTELVAIAIDEISGKIAVCSSSLVNVYRPNTANPEHPRWSLQCHLPAQQDDKIETLSWGLDEELLVGSSSLTLFSTHNAADRLWSKLLANSAKIALFSYDTALIATTGHYDRMVKIWRRLSLADQRFEYDYLPHPTVVTGLCWRRPFHRDQSFDNVLYTFCADKKLRMWSLGDVNSHNILQLWAEIDLMDSIQPRTLDPKDRSTQRFAFMIHSRDFTVATERAVQQASSDESEQMALHHLIEVANRSPEVCVVLDEKGNMSAWGMENVGSRHRMPGDIFNIAHVEGLEIGFNTLHCLGDQWVQFHPFCTEKSSDPFSVLVHHFDGRLDWFEGKLDLLFNPAQQINRLRLKTSWTGHSGEIKKVVRSVTGRSIISRTKNNESVVWLQKKSSTGTRIIRSSVFDTKHHIHRSWILQDGKFVVFLHYDSISLWDTRGPRAVEINRKSYTVQGKPLCLLFIPEVSADVSVVHLATITSEMKGLSWEIHLPPNDGSDPSHTPTLEEFDRFDLGSGDDLAFVLSVDPAGNAPVISGFLDVFARDIAISYTHHGMLTTWTARPDLHHRKLDWLVTAVVDTSVENPSLASGTSIRKAALVNADQTQLTIWSTKGESLEHEARFQHSHGRIHDLDWASTPDGQSILAVGFSHKVLVMGQLRYDYLDSKPAWATLREFSVLEFTNHPIGDSVWLGSGSFVVGAGNQLIVLDDKLQIPDNLKDSIRVSSKKNAEIDIFGLVSRLNGPLPVYHPQYLAQFILCGKIALVQKILLKLWKVLKFYSDGDTIDTMLDLTIDDISEQGSGSNVRKDLHSSYVDFSEEEPESVTEEVASSLNELLTSREIPVLSSREQFLLADIVECVGTVEKHQRSIDENGSRFLLFFRQFVLKQSQRISQNPILSWREITWAYHCESQDILADLVTKHYHGRMLWAHARECGLFMWMKDLTALRTQFEIIARNEYTKSDDKNPVDCSLHYFALRKKAILIGLWRMASWNKEQAATQRLLSNNFSEAKWKTVALKNAYALMGKHRFEYAAAFFLLADHLKDAINVLSTQLNDMQLAIAVARVYEGDHGPVLQEFLTTKVLPKAVNDGNRWMATWALWMLGKRDRAVRALVLPLSIVISPPETPRLDAKLFSADDPALVVLYKQLRERSLQTLRGAVSISPRVEWEFVMHTARLYCRMGCDLLALDLVRTWEFLIQPPTVLPGTYPIQSPTIPNFVSASPQLTAFDPDPRRLLRRRSSLVVDDLSLDFKRHSLTDEPSIIESEEAEPLNLNGNGTKEQKKVSVQDEKKKEEKKKPPPTMFHEPNVNSLLDSFGF